MGKVLTFVLLVLGGIALLTGLGFLFAFPTMWAANYLFSATFLTFVFGTAKLSVLQAWVLNIITGILFRSTSTTNSKS